MQFSDVLAQRATLPSTFTRSGSPYNLLANSKAAALARFTGAVDGLINQIQSMSNAYGVWLDAWGKLWSIPRNTNEKDSDYLSRISAILLAGRGSPAAIELFILIAFGITVSVTEDFTACTWNLVFSAPPNNQQLANIAASLPYVRPAGVPVLSEESGKGGLYLGTVNYLGAPRTTGAYLETPQGAVDTTTQSAFTNNSTPLLPTLFLTDPFLNPSG